MVIFRFLPAPTSACRDEPKNARKDVTRTTAKCNVLRPAVV
ncbi:hypothetical protein MA6G0125R_1761 [Mycobacteroides abscessus 6G-0125-R]|nr:hypothetical protein MA6G0125R_1761 [Mycobacteroides abscessus 6G-0125-R]EIU60502.1 hypothetical protein MA6G1108_2727 [Mycobacteroides abscessus 6G-1108]EIU91828.1 hypothetical protein MA6G0212_2788 [Mycobacteroides abscessus 6G-0212]ETZ61135.1 hypothetical protein L836_2560 [Mycobacteroides abscessus MAB_110811_2726]